MKIKTAEFKKALDIVKPGLGNSNKEIVEQSASFAFVDGKVISYNDEICISTKLSDASIDGVVKAEELFKFIGKVKAAEFEMLTEENEIVLKSGHARVGFALNKEVLLPLDEEVAKVGKWRKIPENFLEACKFASAIASTNMTDPKLTCVHIRNEGIIEASNNYRLVQYDLKVTLPIPTTLIPATSIREVCKVKPTHVAEGEGWIHFKDGNGTVISCRTFEEKYVETDRIVKSIGKTKKIEFPDGLLSVIEKAEIFAKEQQTDGAITLEFGSGKILVKSESLTAWFKESIKYSGEDEFTFRITPYLLKDILKQTNKCGVTKNMLKFVGASWIYITSIS